MLPLQAGDGADGAERDTEIVRHGLEHADLLVEAKLARGPLHVQDAEDPVFRPQREDDRLAGVRIAPLEPRLGDRPAQADSLAARRDPSRDAFVERLLVAQRDLRRQADRSPQAQRVALDEHDRRRRGAYPRRDLICRAREQRGDVARLLEAAEELPVQREPVRG